MAIPTQILFGFADVALYGPHICTIEALIDGDGAAGELSGPGVGVAVLLSEPRRADGALVGEHGSGVVLGERDKQVVGGTGGGRRRGPHRRRWLDEERGGGG